MGVVGLAGREEGRLLQAVSGINAGPCPEQEAGELRNTHEGGCKVERAMGKRELKKIVSNDFVELCRPLGLLHDAYN